MLDIAMQARLPVLRATTNDTVNLPEVLKHLAPKLKIGTYTKSLLVMDVFVAIDEVKVTEALYDSLVENNKTLLLINQVDESGLALDVGEVPVPAELMQELIENVVDEKTALKLLPAFRGLTLKSASEVIRLVLALEGSLTMENVLRERSRITGKLRGLLLVDTATVCYLPDPELSKWVKEERPYFDGAADARLIPRGLLFSGVPGTGKTQGAKFIAREFGLPLYRLDLASSLGKWVGESEANFSRVLSVLDQEEPCVFLIDEVEKLFESGSDDAGVTSRILSQLLWWLQEHQSRILTIMTTNKGKALPAELYRAGRIDRVVEFAPLPDIKSVLALAAGICTSFGIPMSKELKSKLSSSFNGDSVTPANVTQGVLDYIKKSGKCLVS